MLKLNGNDSSLLIFHAVPSADACLAWPDGYLPAPYTEKYYLVETVRKVNRLDKSSCNHLPNGITRLATYETEDTARDLVSFADGTVYFCFNQDKVLVVSSPYNYHFF